MAVKDLSNSYRFKAGVISRNPEGSGQLSRTPKNFNKDNYWLKETQDQVDAYWRLRPNRVDVEQELHFGMDDYISYEVVAQSIKSDTGTAISDDWRKFVFRDISYDCPVGTKFKVSPNYDTTVNEEDKLIFLVFNKENQLTATNSVSVRRCNGTIGSIYLDDHGVTNYHYEPAVQLGITSTDFHYNKMANEPNANLTITVQHNKYTRNYYINQRFIIGYDRVYRISNIDKFYSNDTFHPENIGLMTLHMEIDSIGEKDDFTTRIAYNDPDSINKVEEVSADNYYILVSSIDDSNQLINTSGIVPVVLKTGNNKFQALLYNGDEKQNTPLHLECEIEGMSPEKMENFVANEDEGDNIFNVIKKRYCTSPLKLRFYLEGNENPTGQLIETTITVSLSGIL